jgi:hypothetical protein
MIIAPFMQEQSLLWNAIAHDPATVSRPEPKRPLVIGSDGVGQSDHVIIII